MQDFDLTDNCLSAKASSTKGTYRKTASKFLSRLFYILEVWLNSTFFDIYHYVFIEWQT